MRPGEIDDDFWNRVVEEFKKRKNINIDLDATQILLDILTEWLNRPGLKKVNSK